MEITKGKANLIRQWFGFVDDVAHEKYLEPIDYVLAIEILNECGARVPLRYKERAQTGHAPDIATASSKNEGKMPDDVVAKVKINFEDPRETVVIIRKVIRDADGHIVGIFGLSKSGEWLPKPEGGPYPDECKLPIIIYDNFSEGGKAWDELMAAVASPRKEGG